jgi:hypothetical protein
VCTSGSLRGLAARVNSDISEWQVARCALLARLGVLLPEVGGTVCTTGSPRGVAGGTVCTTCSLEVLLLG